MPTGKLTNKVVVVIGGTAGIGLSATKALIAEGARVVAVGKKLDNVRAAQKQCGQKAFVVAGDAAEPGTASAAIQEALQRFGGFDGLYHVAGGSGRGMGDGPLHELTDAGWQYTLELNLNSVFYSNRAAVRQFLARRTGGSVLNLGSILGISPSPKYFATHAYATAKAAILGMTRSAAACYAKQGIRFNALLPALVDTPMGRRAVNDPEIMSFIATKQPLDGGRAGQPRDLDAAAVYFLSDDSKFVTGQVLAVDGGWSVTEGQISSTPAGPFAIDPAGGS